MQVVKETDLSLIEDLRPYPPDRSQLVPDSPAGECVSERRGVARFCNSSAYLGSADGVVYLHADGVSFEQA